MVSPNDDSTSGSGGTGDTGTSVKTVPESDLIAVKKAHETELAERDVQIKTLTGEVASERVAKEAAETLSSEIPSLRENLATANASIETANASVAAAEASQQSMATAELSRRKEFLKTTYKIDDAKVKDLDESALSAMEAILPGVSKTPAPNGANLDMSPTGGSGDAQKLSPREKIAAGLASQN